MNVVVSNPGAVPEIPHLAAGLARASALRCYLSPFGGDIPRAVNALRASAPKALRRRLDLELGRRTLSGELPLDKVVSCGAFAEMLFVAAQRLRLPAPALGVLVRERNRRFDRIVADQINSHDDALVAPTGAARASFAKSKEYGISSVLLSSISHHRFAAAILAEEEELQPHFASTLQYHTFGKREISLLDEELQLADLIVVLSSFQARTFVEAGIEPSRIEVVPPGVDTELFRPQARTLSSPFRILFVGQLTQRKGLSYLLDAFRSLSIPGAELWLVGRPVGASNLWTAATPGVTHIPHVPRAQLPALYHSAHVFVLPSLVEGFPLTTLEAMATGLPVILSSNTSGADVVTDGCEGYIVPIRDPEAIARALMAVWSDPDRRLAMAGASRRLAERLTWRHYGDKLSARLTARLSIG